MTKGAQYVIDDLWFGKTDQSAANGRSAGFPERKQIAFDVTERVKINPVQHKHQEALECFL